MGNTIRLCTQDSGCSQQPRNVATFQPQQSSPEDSQIAALEEKAKQDPRAAFDLALRYFRGDGIRRNTYQAITWMRDAAERGYPQAQLALGRFYLSGMEEMGSDPAEAESWLLLAAERGDPEAKTLLAQAQQAKKDEVAYRRWLNAHRAAWLGYWSSGYHYYSYWRNGAWYFY
ncbi:tetratricopeptide repeat protein [Chitinasiproducens palmae]|uniref:Sel1 repeat-containing protein n=1 Tax=Chitinasiproducens palmae TaxID=1770053 RepID=A0A1H2PPQ8_9BURK|nr:sel1 repeat family protein [Chitinasiproducens palmae]SDV48301.1 Sel1 repeat-containing protein [Chitinasiproducens palmae]